MDELIASGLMRFTDLDRENGTLDLDKCGDEIPSAWRKRRSAEARKKAERSAREAAAKKAKAEREEKERQRLAARREAEAKRRADAAAVKARRSSGAAAAASAKRRRGDAGASMLMAAVDFVESARREDVHSDDESRPPKTKRGRSNERSNATRSTEISEEEEAAAAVESLEAAAAVESLGGVTPSPPRDREDSVEGGGGDEVTPPSGGEKMAPPTGHPPTSAGYVPPRKTSLSSTAVHVLGSIARRVGGSFGGGGGAGGGAGGVAPTPRDPATPATPATAATPSNEDGDEDSGATATEEVAPTAVTAATGRMILGASSEDDRRRVVAVDVSPAVATTSRRMTFHEASEVFRGGSSTTWMIRLLASWMSPTDAATRDRHVAALAALEEKKYDFAERLVLDAESDDAWSWRMLEYCDLARGRLNAAGVKAERAVAADAKVREEERSRERVEDSATDGGASTRARRTSTPRSGSLPFPGRGPGTAGAIGAVFKLVMDVAGEPGDWSGVSMRARELAARYPTNALLLALHGGASWRRGDLAGSVAPLRAAMHHDGNEARAAPWLFEVLLRLDLKDDAEWVWDKALETNREMSRKLMRVARRVDPKPAR